MKDVAKSLHTVTVLVQVAGVFRTWGGGSNESAMNDAMNALGLAGRPDPYGLKAKALKAMGG